MRALAAATHANDMPAKAQGQLLGAAFDLNRGSHEKYALTPWTTRMT